MTANHKIYAIGEEGLTNVVTTLTQSSGGSVPPSGLEARIAKLEATMEHVQSDIGEIKTDIRNMKKEAREDFRVLFGALIIAALGLAGLMAKGFGWL